MIEETLAIIKPDITSSKRVGKIITLIEENGFDILQMKKTTWNKNTAERFYAVHKGKPFYNNLISFITSGPIVLLKLRKENAIADWRTLMGKTNPQEAASGTIRGLYGDPNNMLYNAVHGSDAPETAAQELEIAFNS